MVNLVLQKVWRLGCLSVLLWAAQMAQKTAGRKVVPSAVPSADWMGRHLAVMSAAQRVPL